VSKSELEEEFYRWVIREGWRPKREYRFHPFRRWRFDFAWPRKKIGVEIEGGVWTGGRHVRPAGFEKDCEKYNEAAACGWKVLRVTGKMLADKDQIKEWLEKLIGRRSKKSS